MRFYSITCPFCGGTIETTIDDDTKTVVCPHCGETTEIASNSPNDYAVFID